MLYLQRLVGWDKPKKARGSIPFLHKLIKDGLVLANCPPPTNDEILTAMR